MSADKSNGLSTDEDLRSGKARPKRRRDILNERVDIRETYI